MKKFYLLLLTMLLSMSIYAQEVSIGTGTSTQVYPLGNYFGFERSASLYKVAELQNTGNITAISWYANVAGLGNRPIKIYLKETTAHTLTASNWASLISGATLVYSGNLTPVTGWNPFILTSLFNYSGNQNNLLVLVEANFGGGGLTGFVGNQIRYSNALNSHLYFCGDDFAPMGNGTLSDNRPNIKLNFGPMLTCFATSQVNVSNIASTTATISWTASVPVPANGYRYEVRTSGAAGSGATGLVDSGVVAAGVLTKNLSSLTSNTSYSVYIQSICSTTDQSEWSEAITFLTLCDIETVPYIVEMPSSGVPVCFDLQNVNDDSTLWTSAATQTGITGRVMSLSASSTLASDDWFYLQGLKLTAGQEYRISFKYKKGTADANQKLKIAYGLSTIHTAMTNQIGEVIFSNTIDVQSQYFDFIPTTTGAYYIGFHGYADSNQGTLNVGEIKVENSPSCFAPLNFHLTDVTKNSVKLNWEHPTTTPSDGYAYEVRTSGPAGSGTTGLFQSGVTSATEIQKVISSLDPSTTYTLYLSSVCGVNNHSIWMNTGEITTLCNLPDYELTTSASDLSFCGPHEVILEVNTQGIVNWYNSATSTTPIHSGNTYTTTVSATSSFWYEVSSLESTGPLNAEAVSTTSVGNWEIEWDVYFTIFEPTKLKSIDIYPSTAGQTGKMIFKQRGATGSAIVGTIDYTTVGANRTVKQVVPIDLQLLPGTYVIETTLPSGGMLRNTNGASYPYSSEVASITGNKYLTSYYMGYYNWIFETGCTSPRTEVVATINPIPNAPTAVDQQFCIAENATIANLVATGTDIKWYETTTASIALNLTDALTSGSYFVSTTENGCESDRTEIQVTINETPTPTAVDQQFCITENATIANLVATGADIKWYETATSSIALNLTDALTSGNYFATQTLNECESISRKEVQITINETPAPTAIDQEFCIAENATVANLNATGDNIKWYESANSATALNANATLVNGASYFASQTVNDCESANRTQVLVTIHNTPAPTAVDQEFCIAENATVANLNATGDNIKWYESANSATALNTNVALVNGTSYYASQTVSGCESVTRKKVVVTIHNTPAPTAVDQEFCIAENATVANLNATGDNIKWYESANSATALNTNVALVNGASYYASQTVSGCESVTRKEVAVTIHDTPAPTAVDQEFCIVENATVANLNATGDNIKWYESANSATALNTNVALVNGASYFASQTVSGCESITRKKVVVTIHNTPAPTAVDQEFCIVENATVANLNATGDNIKWYESANSVTALNTNVALVNGASYFASQTMSGCESVTRKEVVVTIHNTPAPTAIDQEFCIAENATVANLNATGTDIKWYNVSTGGTALNTNLALVNGTSYFASQTVSGCESVTRKKVVVTIHNTPAPTTTAIQEFCSNASHKISDLVITGTDIKWYETATSTTALNTNTNLINGLTYYATQTLNGCESTNRVQVQVQISTPPNLPTGDSIQTFCGNATVADLVVVGLTGAELIWYQSQFSNTILPTSTPLTNGTYYVAQKVGVCISDRKPVTARIINTNPPNVGAFEFCGSAVVADLYIPAPTGVTYKWYNSPSNPNALEPNTVLNTGTYFVSKNQYNCENQRTAVSVVIKDLPNSPTGVSPQTFIEGSTLNQIIVNPTTAVYYITEEDAKTNTNPLSENMPLVNGTTYYAVNIGTNGCPSLPTPITIEVYLSNNEFEKDKLKYYPNPVNNKLNIEYFENIIQIVVYDLLGRNIKTIQMNDRNVEIDLSELSSSTYMIKLKTESKEQFIKIIKN